MFRLKNKIHQLFLKRKLTKEESIILKAVNKKYGSHTNDKLYFIKNNKLSSLKSSAMLMVWGENNDGPIVHLTNISDLLLSNEMGVDEISETQF